MSTSKQIQFTTKAFKKMKRLRLLKVHQDAQYDSLVKYCKDVHIPNGLLPRNFTFPSYDLRYLHWDGYPLKSLPSSFHAENLVVLSLQSSGIKNLCDNKVFEKLKVLNVSYSLHLIKIPDFSSVPNLEILIVKGCQKLRNIPEGIHKLKRLTTLCCTGCSKLKSFPKIMGVMKNLREVYLDRTGIRNLPWSIERLEGVQHLDLAHCENLESLPESIYNLRSLKTLIVHNCSKLHQFPHTMMDFEEDFEELFCVPNPSAYSYELPVSPNFFSQPFVNLESEFPELGKLDPKFLQPGILSPQLESQQEPESPKTEIPPRGTPKKSHWEDQMREVILTGGCSLYLLEELDLSYCNLKEGGITSEFFHLPSLQLLNLSGNNICKIPPNISKLSKLRILKISHCKLLLEIPVLPSNLREIDAHGCPSLLPLQRQTQLLQSLLNCLKSDIQDFERGFGSSDIFIPGSLYDGKGISLFIDGSNEDPDWIRHKNIGNEVIIQLPLNWYKDKDLLGFSLFYCHVLANRSKEKAEDEDPSPYSLKCELSFLDEQFGTMDDLFLDCFCGCYNITGGASDKVWVIYYPKVGVKEMFQSNKYRLLKASFRGKNVKVEKCGINLIYANDDGLNHPTMLRNCLGHFDDNASAAKSTIHKTKTRNDVNLAEEHPNKKLRGLSTDLTL